MKPECVLKKMKSDVNSFVYTIKDLRGFFLSAILCLIPYLYLILFIVTITWSIDELLEKEYLIDMNIIGSMFFIICLICMFANSAFAVSDEKLMRIISASNILLCTILYLYIFTGSYNIITYNTLYTDTIIIVLPFVWFAINILLIWVIKSYRYCEKEAEQNKIFKRRNES